MLSYDPSTGLALVLDRETGLLVDLSLCVDSSSNTWIGVRLATIMIIGHLETASSQLPIPMLPYYASPPIVDPHIYLQALLVVATPGLDLNLWNTSINEG